MSATDRHSRHLGVLLNLPAAFLLALLALTPLIFAIGPRLESDYFPVVRHLIDDNDTPEVTADDALLPIVAAEYPGPESEDPYVDIFVQFDKIRQCDFLIEERIVGDEIVRVNRSLSWYDDTGRRLRIEFEPDDVDLPASRPVGEQVAGPWRIHGIRTTDGSTAVVAHRCHPLWLTYSQFHP
uniref:Uncharacterized protein n=1 Tax=Dinoroseobacter phage vB_DshS_R26L TaxID=3161158 RepID=A0AAU7VG06_9CAUD